MSEEEEVSNVSKKKNILGTDLLFNPDSNRVLGLHRPISILGLSAIPEVLKSYNLGLSAMAAEALKPSIFVAAISEVLKDASTRQSSIVPEVLKSTTFYSSAISETLKSAILYPSMISGSLGHSISGSFATISEALSYSTLSSLGAVSKTLKDYYSTLDSFAAVSEALESSTFSSYAAISEALKDASTRQSSIISEALKYNAFYSSAISETFKSATLYPSITSGSLGYPIFGSFATKTEAINNALTLHLSRISEVLKPTTTCSSAIFEKSNFLKIQPVEEIETLSLTAEDPRQIFPNLTANLERVNLEELNSEIQSDYEIDDFEINSKAYKFLCNLETYLRHLITKRIIEPYKKILRTRFHKTY